MSFKPALAPEALSEIFGSFAGRRIAVIEPNAEYGDASPLNRYRFADDADPTILSIREIAGAFGLTAKFWIAGNPQTITPTDDRVNIIVAKDEAGAYRIAPSFAIY